MSGTGSAPPRTRARLWRSRWFWSGLALLAVFLAANHPLLSGVAAARWDADVFFAPFQMLVADHARAGRFLLWNPWSNGGSPDFAEPQVGAFSPLAMLTGLVTGGLEPGYRVYWLLVWFLGGAGVLALGRHLGAPAWAAVLVALGFLFSGYNTGHAEHLSWIRSLAWLPFLIWRLDVALISGRKRPALEAGVCWGLSALGGYPGHVLLNGGYAFLWALGRWWSTRSQGKAMAQQTRAPGPGGVLTALGLTFVIGLVVMLPTYFGLVFETRGYSSRAEALTREFAISSNALHPGALVTLASSYLTTFTETLWPYTDPSSSGVYLGPVIPWLALTALVLRPRARFRWWLAGLAMFALGCALSRVFPFRGWLYDWVPPTRFFRGATMFRGYAMFSLVVLALLAGRDLQQSCASRPGWKLLLPACICALSALVAFHVTLAMVPGPHPRLAVAQVWVVWPALVGVALLAATVGRSRPGFLPWALLALALPDAFATRQLSVSTLETHKQPILDLWQEIDASHRASLDLGEEGLGRRATANLGRLLSNKNFSAKTPVLESYAALRNDLHLRWVEQPVLVASAIGRDRIWFSEEVAEVAPSPAAFEAFVERARALGFPPLVIHSRDSLLAGSTGAQNHDDEDHGAEDQVAEMEVAEMEAIQALPRAQRVQIERVTYTPTELSFRVECPAAGWLLVTDRWARGWRASVDGQPTPVLGGAFLFRAVRVHAGVNLIRFTYQPFGWPWFLVLSWSTVASILLWSLHDVLRPGARFSA